MKRYGLIGKPLSHSFSAHYFDHKFKKEKIEATYRLFELNKIQELHLLIEKHALSGFNVTIPYKEEIIPYLDEISNEAQMIGAVNCVHIVEGKLHGHNTDFIGFSDSLSNVLNHTKGGRALILGDGGSAKAVKFALTQLKIEYQVVSRSGALNYDNLHANHIREVDLIVNTTPLGMHPNVEAYPIIPYEAISSKQTCFDLIYNPQETMFLSKAKLAGAKTLNGQSMLEVQAEKSWEIWTAKA